MATLSPTSNPVTPSPIAVTGFVAQYQGTEAIVIGQDYLPAHILEVVKNPEATIS